MGDTFLNLADSEALLQCQHRIKLVGKIEGAILFDNTVAIILDCLYSILGPSSGADPLTTISRDFFQSSSSLGGCQDTL